MNPSTNSPATRNDFPPDFVNACNLQLRMYFCAMNYIRPLGHWLTIAALFVFFQVGYEPAPKLPSVPGSGAAETEQLKANSPIPAAQAKLQSPAPVAGPATTPGKSHFSPYWMPGRLIVQPDLCPSHSKGVAAEQTYWRTVHLWRILFPFHDFY
jgi:hypothetical protein